MGQGGTPSVRIYAPNCAVLHGVLRRCAVLSQCAICCADVCGVRFEAPMDDPGKPYIPFSGILNFDEFRAVFRRFACRTPGDVGQGVNWA